MKGLSVGFTKYSSFALSSIEGAKGILFTISGGPDLGMHEVNEAAKIITQSADPNAKIIFGSVINENMKNDIKITVVATGFGEKSSRPKEAGAEGNKAAEPKKVIDFKPFEDHETVEETKTQEEKDLEIPAFIRRRIKK